MRYGSVHLADDANAGPPGREAAQLAADEAAADPDEALVQDRAAVLVGRRARAGEQDADAGDGARARAHGDADGLAATGVQRARPHAQPQRRARVARAAVLAALAGGLDRDGDGARPAAGGHAQHAGARRGEDPAAPDGGRVAVRVLAVRHGDLGLAARSERALA